MKIFALIILSIIHLNLLIIPLWDLEASSVDLEKSITKIDHSIEFTIFKEKKYNINIILKKKIMENSIKNGMYIEQNYINIDGEEQKTEWEDIESLYFIENHGLFICPKGKNFLNLYINGTFKELIPESFEIYENDWELKCFYQPDHNTLFFGFLNLSTDSRNNFYGLELSSSKNANLKYKESIRGTLYDFIWTKNSKNNKEKDYSMLSITSFREYYFNLMNVLIDNDKISYNAIISRVIDYQSKFFYSYFDNNHNNNILYWFAANSTSEFHSGFSINPIDIDTSPFSQIFIHKNTTSPFNFLYHNKTIIKKLNIIRNTRFIYYEIEYNKNNYKMKETYYGIIDIKLNKIIFNTNEILKEFKPLNNHSILAFTESEAYQICAIKENDMCVDRCSSGEIILDTENGNFCAENQECINFILIPDDICIKECDQRIFMSKFDKCGLCKYLNDKRKYTNINGGCSLRKPENAYYVNEDMLVFDLCDSFCERCSNAEKCDECSYGYKELNGKCIAKCHDKCLKCSEYSDNDNEQKCLSCKENMLFDEKKGNCFCVNGYYENNNSCLKCHENCETCSEGAEKNGDIENQNCKSCNSNWKYLVDAKGYSKNCVNQCPKGTEVKGNYCIYKEIKKNYTYVYIILTIILIMAFALIIFRYIHKVRIQNMSEEPINEINMIMKNKRLVED